MQTTKEKKPTPTYCIIIAHTSYFSSRKINERADSLSGFKRYIHFQNLSFRETILTLACSMCQKLTVPFSVTNYCLPCFCFALPKKMQNRTLNTGHFGLHFWCCLKCNLILAWVTYIGLHTGPWTLHRSSLKRPEKTFILNIFYVKMNIYCTNNKSVTLLLNSRLTNFLRADVMAQVSPCRSWSWVQMNEK